MYIATGWRARHRALRAAPMHEGVVRPPNFHQRYDLRAGGDVLSVMRHRVERALPGPFRRARIRAL